MLIICVSPEKSRNSGDIFIQTTILLLLFIMVNYKNYYRERGRRLDFIISRMGHDKKEECHNLLSNMLPGELYVQQLLGEQQEITSFENEVTLLFSDIKGFTALTLAVNDSVKLVMMLNALYSAFDRKLEEFSNIWKIDTEGDAVILVCGLIGRVRHLEQNRKGESSLSHHTNGKHNNIVQDAIWVLDFANDMLFEMQKWNTQWHLEDNGWSVSLRIGVHTGSVVSGIIGKKTPKFWLWGEDCHIAKKMESSGEAGRIHVSATTYELISQHDQCPHSFEKREAKVKLDPYGLEMQTYWLAEQVTPRILGVQLQTQLKLVKENETEVLKIRQQNQ